MRKPKIYDFPLIAIDCFEDYDNKSLKVQIA